MKFSNSLRSWKLFLTSGAYQCSIRLVISTPVTSHPTMLPPNRFPGMLIPLMPLQTQDPGILAQLSMPPSMPPHNSAATHPVQTDSAATMPIAIDVGFKLHAMSITAGITESGLVQQADLKILTPSNAEARQLEESYSQRLNQILSSAADRVEKLKALSAEIKASAAGTPQEDDNSGSLLGGYATAVGHFATICDAPAFLSLTERDQRSLLTFAGELSQHLRGNQRYADFVNQRHSQGIAFEWMGSFERCISKNGAPLLKRDDAGRAVFEHLRAILLNPNLESNFRFTLVLDLLADIDNPSRAALQTLYPHCGSAAFQHYVVNEQPAEYVRIVSDLYSSGEARMRSGALVTFSKSDKEVAEQSFRSLGSAVFQVAMIRHVVGGNDDQRALLKGIPMASLGGLMSDLTGKPYLVLGNANGLLRLIREHPQQRFVGGFSSFEGAGHAVVFEGLQSERVSFRDSNGNYGLHPHGFDFRKAMEGAPQEILWHWSECIDAGKVVLPKGAFPVTLSVRPGLVEFMFQGVKSGADLPPPHLTRSNPTRRLDSWSSGEFSMSTEDFGALGNTVFLAVPESMAGKYLPPPPRSFFEEMAIPALFGALGGLGVYMYKNLRHRGDKRKQTSEE